MKMYLDLEEIRKYEDEMIKKGVWNEEDRFDESLVDEEKLLCIIEGNFDDGVLLLVNEGDEENNKWFEIVGGNGELVKIEVDEKEILQYILFGLSNEGY